MKEDIPKIIITSRFFNTVKLFKQLEEFNIDYDYDLDLLKSCNVDYRLVLRNLVVPEIGKNIFEKLTDGLE